MDCSSNALLSDFVLCVFSMLESVEALRKKAKKSSSPEHTAFQYLFLLVGIQMFKVCFF